ncbi:MAG TPA: DUF2024 family protein [Chitinophagales bacterium]|nr:DUF2024 family protein [Chitinophagales bacterium]HRK26948.1 DUF2024 family protein [Chitinophagales bacterium]
MKVVVWDTYVPMPSGNVLNFDIIVPDFLQDSNLIHGFGNAYLAEHKGFTAQLNTTHCQRCHIEEPSPDIIAAIQKQGYYILELCEIPPILPPNPTRRELILHLRAFFEPYRFADFKGISEQELQIMVKQNYLPAVYHPISCTFHDMLLEKATLKQTCQITFFTQTNEVDSEESIIIDLFSKNGEEVLTLQSGNNIRLDKIVAVNGLFAPTHCITK